MVMRICPVCGSEKIETDRTNFLALIGMERGYVCPDCEYRGRLFLDIDQDRLDEAREFLEDRDIEDFRDSIMDQEMGFNKGKIAFGIAFLFMGISLLIFMPIGVNFFIGVLSAFIGLALLHGESKKLN